MKNHKKSLYIVLPHRIGDCLLTIPAIKCLQELDKLYTNNIYDIKLISGARMFAFLQKQNIAKVEKLTIKAKVFSWFKTCDKLFCYLVSSKIIGLHSKESYGQSSKQKWYLHFTHNIPYLIENNCTLFPDKDLYNFFKEQYGFSDVIINNFGLCLSLGYSAEQIKLAIKAISEKHLLTKKYIVMCLEAGYNKKHCSNRRWSESDFFMLADYLYETYNISTVFVGINRKPAIPNKDYFKDARGKTSVTDLATIITNSTGYIGNDTGPLHLANYLKKPTLGIYTESSPDSYGPIYASNNLPLYNPTDIQSLKDTVDKMVKDYLN